MKTMADSNNNEENNNEEKKEKTAAEMRKINKPLMEKKRRERINNCLNQLKMFLMDATKKDSSYYSKLEKADILEMTVKYLKNLQRQQLSVAMTTDPKVIHKYTAGFTQCANEVTRYLSKIDGFNPEVKSRISNHLSNALNKMNTSVPPPGGVGQQISSPLTLQLGQGQTPLGLQMAAAVPGSGGIVVPQSQAGEFPMGQLASAVMSSMASASASNNAAVSSTTSTPTFPTQLCQGPQPLQGAAQNIFGNSAAMMSAAAIAAASQQQPQQQQQQHAQVQAQAQAQAQGVPVLPVQLIPAKLPSGDLVFLMTNQSTMPVTNVMTPMSIQIPGSSTNPGNPINMVSPIPAAQGTPTMQQPTSGTQPLSIGLSQLPTSSAIAPSSSVAVVPPQIQEPKPTTSSSGLPDTSSDTFNKPKPMFPLFSFPPQDKPLDLGIGSSSSSSSFSSSGVVFPVKQEKSDFSGAKPKSVPTATVTSSSSFSDTSSEGSPPRDEHMSPQPRGHGHPQFQGHQGQGQNQNIGQGYHQGHVVAAAANQILPLPQGNILNLQHDSMWRPW